MELIIFTSPGNENTGLSTKDDTSEMYAVVTTTTLSIYFLIRCRN